MSRKITQPEKEDSGMKVWMVRIVDISEDFPDNLTDHLLGLLTVLTYTGVFI